MKPAFFCSCEDVDVVDRRRDCASESGLLATGLLTAELHRTMRDGHVAARHPLWLRWLSITKAHLVLTIGDDSSERRSELEEMQPSLRIHI